MQRTSGKKTKGLLLVLIVAAAYIALPTQPTHAGTCPATRTLDDIDLRKAGGGYLDEQQLFNKCWDHVQDCSDVVVETGKCKSSGQQRISVLKGQQSQTPKGECKLADAKSTFFATEKTFKEISESLKAAVDGLTKEFDPKVAQYKQESFGPQNNRQSQQENRDAARVQLTKVKESFDASLNKYSTLSSVDCFDCSVLETYAVLQGAANLVAHSHSFEVEGVKVGLSKFTDTLQNTDEDDSESGSLTATTLRKIATPAPSPKSLKLDDLRRQWVGALDADYVQQMKDIICELADDTTSNAYFVALKYYPYAVRMQKVVNKLWHVRQIKYTDSAGVEQTTLTTYARQADQAVGGAASDTTDIKTLYADVGPVGTNKKKCANEPAIELRAFSPTPGISTLKTGRPVWCPTRP